MCHALKIPFTLGFLIHLVNDRANGLSFAVVIGLCDLALILETEPIEIWGSVITYNEADKIRRCLESMFQVCEQVVVLDSYSQDDTVQIAEQMGAVVYQQAFVGHIEQKNAA